MNREFTEHLYRLQTAAEAAVAQAEAAKAAPMDGSTTIEANAEIERSLNHAIVLARLQLKDANKTLDLYWHHHGGTRPPYNDDDVPF